MDQNGSATKLRFERPITVEELEAALAGCDMGAVDEGGDYSLTAMFGPPDDPESLRVIGWVRENIGDLDTPTFLATLAMALYIVDHR